MTATRTQKTAIDQRLILELSIDAQGEVTRKPSQLGRKDTLEGKLLAEIYPGIQVARVSVPHELTPYEQSVVENRMAKLIYGGVEYRLVGASNSAKDGKFYFVDLAHSKQIAERFQHWPEAAMVYFAILVSDCKLMVDEPNFRVAVVQEHALGTNDCRGWVRESVYRKLKIGTNRFCQFRLAFDAHEPKQAKGALKAMSDRVADRLGVDLILPDSATKPALKGGLRFLPQLGTSGRLYTGPAVLGIKEISRVLEFGSSYTLVEHASEDSLQLEIMPRAIEQIRKVRKAWDEGDYDALLELLGKSSDVAAFEDEDSSFDPESLERGVSHVSEEWEPAEAVLLADRIGTSIKVKSEEGHTRPIIATAPLFRGHQGTLAVEPWSAENKSLRGTVAPLFYTAAGEVLDLLERFDEAIRNITGAVACPGCKHTHVAVTPATNKGGER